MAMATMHLMLFVFYSLSLNRKHGKEKYLASDRKISTANIISYDLKAYYIL